MLTPDSIYQDSVFNEDEDENDGWETQIAPDTAAPSVSDQALTRARSRFPGAGSVFTFSARCPSPRRRAVGDAMALSATATTLLSGSKTMYSDATVDTEDLIPIFAACYGFHAEPSYMPTKREEDQKLDTKTVMQLFAQLPHSGSFTGPEQPAIHDFVNHVMLRSSVTVDSPLGSLCDLLPTCTRHLALHKAASTRLQCDTQGSVLYIWRSSEDTAGNQSWMLVIIKAATALEIVRHKWGPEKEDNAQEIVKHGISFVMLWPLSATCQLVKPPPIGGWQGLGFRELGYQSEVLDYMLYLERCRAVLRHPNIHLAFGRGGIIWRLAYEEMDLSRVSFGPSEESDEKVVHWLKGVAYEDATLSEDNLNHICSVYRIYAKSGMHVGYWTKMNEEWFVHCQNYLQQGIHEGNKSKLDLKNAKAWHQALRYESNKQWDFL
ncbi:uncharacterized protein PHACADRAFT_107000 [Phanerochaete carnosa HHB-10118-sp]|uniref:Uncharacterized protein n=1 Tax=Phanerochaete carnosa (strain HHB-10118-sp) TaxID=650164 RepID=K5UIK1_PHACS|nr:uncharacterized protein PHACADRAFT_107000 [Phanerochaete carnosa HHB-10118-sp]EKM49326.1 hypothetical protein PHACADRAFT_107000 [Phanerochaete carnosa HHB-10118-sp]